MIRRYLFSEKNVSVIVNPLSNEIHLIFLSYPPLLTRAGENIGIFPLKITDTFRYISPQNRRKFKYIFSQNWRNVICIFFSKSEKAVI
jgi:hypothetical protein